MLENKIQEQIDSLYELVDLGGPDWYIEDLFEKISFLKSQIITLEDMDMGS